MPTLAEATMPYALRESLRSCFVGENIVFLDVETGRYSILALPFVPGFWRWMQGAALSLADEDMLERLAEQGLLAIALDETKPVANLSSTVSPEAVVMTKGHRPGLWSVMRAFGGRLLWSWRVRHWSFARLIIQIGRFRAEEATGPSLPLSEVLLARTVRSFEFVDLILGSHDQCLARSLALTAACRKLKLACTLVIGVRAVPFAAHSWVQQDNLILNEKPDQALLFTPILVA